METSEISLIQLHKPGMREACGTNSSLNMKDQNQVNSTSVLEQKEMGASTPEKYRFIIPPFSAQLKPSVDWITPSNSDDVLFYSQSNENQSLPPTCRKKRFISFMSCILVKLVHKNSLQRLTSCQPSAHLPLLTQCLKQKQ